MSAEFLIKLKRNVKLQWFEIDRLNETFEPNAFLKVCSLRIRHEKIENIGLCFRFRNKK